MTDPHLADGPVDAEHGQQAADHESDRQRRGELTNSSESVRSSQRHGSGRDDEAAEFRPGSNGTPAQVRRGGQSQALVWFTESPACRLYGLDSAEEALVA